MRRCSAVFGAFVLLCAVARPAGAAEPAFAKSLVQRYSRYAEPKLYVDDRTQPPTLYVAAIDSANTYVWRSSDGGATFERLAASLGGGGDGDIVIDTAGTMYVADLYDPAGNTVFPVSVSTDGGRTYTRSTNVAPPGSDLDREWVATNAAGHLLGMATDGATHTLKAWLSADSARTFGDAVNVATEVRIQGPVVTGPNGWYYTLYDNVPTGLHLARSPDGVHWTTPFIADTSPDWFPVVAVDAASNLYAVWTDNNDVVYTSHSTDNGTTWSVPVNLSPNTSEIEGLTPTAVFPWIVAGSRGRVGVTYAIARQAIGPNLGVNGSDLGGPQTTWDFVLAESTNALGRRPTWSSTVVVEGFHTGSICETTPACTVTAFNGQPFDRDLLDFAGAGLDAAGNVYLSYMQDAAMDPADPITAIDLVFPLNDLMLARQTAGQRLK